RSGRPVVVIPEPIRIMGWSYDVERSMLEPRGIALIVPETEAEARAAMSDADVIFTSSPINADDIATLRNCVGILCYSVGMDYVDAEAAKARGIPVWNCPTSNNEEVSDHAVLLILAAQRRLLPFATAAKQGNWDIYEWPLLSEIHQMRNRTIGIIGLGRIGHLIAQKLHGFRSTVIACDPFIEKTRDPDVELVSLDELAARADILVSAAALTDTSRGIINREFLAKTRPGVLIVNVSRGGIVVEEALREALDSGHVAYAALDVRSPEPPDPKHDLLTDHPKATLTQHIAASSQESVAGLHIEAAEQIIRLLEQAGRLSNPVDFTQPAVADTVRRRNRDAARPV
ncbi:MAG TPA: NAD(P)-dependent oxidoreductase, partial [Candidatus Saccharimonadales bacterium]|nr:NAD(P)-dependent oxidoreductase [Candidatus Saccharimonadales bacterium]